MTINHPNKINAEDKSVDFIYSCYLLHKHPKEKILEILKEWKRVIKDGGQIHISVPDYFLLSDKYLKSKCKIEEVNRILSESKIYLDFLMIQRLLVQSGFYAVKRFDVERNPPKKEDMSLYEIGGQIISLNIEAYG